jgi:hypothetical protein
MNFFVLLSLVLGSVVLLLVSVPLLLLVFWAVNKWILKRRTITNYSSNYVGGDDLKNTYQIVFKNGQDLALKRTLDSLIIANPKWKHIDDEYVYDTIFWENEVVDSIIIRPLDGSATFINYKW